jgi:hypothetical protein
MNNIKYMYIGLSLLLVACNIQKPKAQSTAERAQNGISNNTPLPTGNYFVVNAANLALTPLSPTAGQNVFLQPFNHGGLQQWQITKQPGVTNSYIIKLAGSDAMLFQPHDIKDRTGIISPSRGGTTFRIQAVPGKPNYWYIKSVKYNGDAMHSFVFSPDLATELRFDPAMPEPKFMWRFEKATEQ